MGDSLEELIAEWHRLNTKAARARCALLNAAPALIAEVRASRKGCSFCAGVDEVAILSATLRERDLQMAAIVEAVSAIAEEAVFHGGDLAAGIRDHVRKALAIARGT